MELRFKKLHPNAVLPSRAKPGDAGYDLVVSETDPNQRYKVRFGLAVEIPEGHVGLIFPRSSIHKKNVVLSNSVGVIDSGYRGELMAVFREIDSPFKYPHPYQVGDRAAQLIVLPIPDFEPTWVDELSETERGDGGFGSTGE